MLLTKKQVRVNRYDGNNDSNLLTDLVGRIDFLCRAVCNDLLSVDRIKLGRFGRKLNSKSVKSTQQRHHYLNQLQLDNHCH